jgi:hypothetical protein
VDGVELDLHVDIITEVHIDNRLFCQQQIIGPVMGKDWNETLV